MKVGIRSGFNEIWISLDEVTQRLWNKLKAKKVLLDLQAS